MNWLKSMLIALILIFGVWVVSVSYAQVARSEISAFALVLVFVRIAVLVTLSGGIAGWMGA